MKSKWILVGDMHLYVFGDMAIQSQYIDEQLSPMVDGETYLFFSGDQFNENKPIETELVQFISDRFAPILRRAKRVFMLVGNHDTAKIKEIEKNNNNIFKLLPNVTIVDKPMTCEVDGQRILMTPYMVDHVELQTIIDGHDDDILFCHANIDKVVFDNGHQMLKNTLYAENLKKFKLVINGHIHKPQIVDNILNLGSPWQTKFGDRGSECGIYVVNPEDLPRYYTDIELFEETKIENTISPRFYKIPYKNLIKMTPEYLKTLGGQNVWVTDSEDNKEVEKIFEGIEVRTLRVGVAETEISGVGIDYQHNENVMDNFSPYLKTLKKFQVGEKLIEINDEFIVELEKTLDRL